MTRLRKMMLEELQRRNYAQTTIKNYLGTVEGFAKHFGRPPDQLGLDEIRTYQAYLLKERKMGVRTVGSLHRRLLRRPRSHSPTHAFAPVGGAGSPPTRRAIPERDARHAWAPLTFGFAIK